jgi:Tol biopolymer transport system component
MLTRPGLRLGWRFIGAWALAGSIGLAPSIARPPATSDDAQREARFITRVRQLTFDGRRAGEGYFAADGSRLVFQSEREPGNPFYQIYELNLETGDTRRISTGMGKTTCAFYQSTTGDILFASTHEDSRSAELQRAEFELRASGKQRRYAWDYDPRMELFVSDAGTGELTRLTDVEGYDAEASFSPDGEWIVFASTRSAYDRELSDDERKRLEFDASFFAEIYLMRADGSDTLRLTNTPGYDGGPFFSADGTRIVWRRFNIEGLIADIWTMKLDGSDQRRITDFESMSWAPFPHPSGEYIIFTTNKLGFDNFELFIVDTAGTKQPVRVTYTPGFDGLPVPSPDGRRLAWTSTRKGSGAQLFMAQWNHEQALEALRQAPSAGASARIGENE